MDLVATSTLRALLLIVGGGLALTGCGGGGGSGNVGSTTPPPPVKTWVTAASSPILLSAQTATLLQNGTVLVVGGDPWQNPAQAAVYDPVANTWSATNPPATARYGATATLLQDGRVLVAGGYTNQPASPCCLGPTIYLSSAELYDPATRAWSGAADMPSPRELHAAVLLPSGKVFLVGGDDGHQSLPDALLYDPGANTWTSTTTLLTPGPLPTATVLKSGTVLVTTGTGDNTIGFSEIYDPISAAWLDELDMHNVHLLRATATLLADGRVLLAGGQTGIQPGSTMSVPEVYDPATNIWSLAGTMTNGRVEHTATLLPSGKVLVAGGYNSSLAEFSSTELYDPSANTWSGAASMSTGRDHHGAVLLQDGAVFVTGGQNQGLALQTSELYR